ncbi:hypothetical protein [Burkholderia ubonensis]|uniref:hypothetical protein n=1 Tax=Burkholderia ubonensis TaxID=101571 RepID=UPI00075327B1|nr:hypothetical protein [Burkholderia ubonensis]KVD63267.1 hypothetical protein WI88_09995 [Burkholderia ubonensis]
MADNKKQGNTSGWAGVGDSAEGIRNLRPDVLRQVQEQAKAIKSSGGSTSSTPAASTNKPTKTNK